MNEQLETGSGARRQPRRRRSAPRSARSPCATAVLGLAVGLVFGLGMAFLYEYLDNTIKSDEEAEKLYGVPVLGHIPFVKLDKGVEQHLAIVEKPGSAAAESYRVLRNSLDFINFEHKIKTLMVTSSAPSEGKSTVAANLAASLAQAGAKVAMVSCDFRRPTTEGFFGVPNVLGLSDVLLGRNSLKAALQRPGDEQLLVLTSGKMPPNPSELLGSTKMQELVQEPRGVGGLGHHRHAAAARRLRRRGRRALGRRRAAGQPRRASRRARAPRRAPRCWRTSARTSSASSISGSEEGGRDGGYYAGAAYYNHYYSYYSANANAAEKRAKKADSGARAPDEGAATAPAATRRLDPAEEPGTRVRGGAWVV